MLRHRSPGDRQGQSQLRLLGIAVLILLAGRSAGAVEPAAQDDAFVVDHCTSCHDAASRKGRLDLTALAFAPKDPANLAIGIKVHDRVKAGEMPPRGQDRPDPARREAFVEGLARPIASADVSYLQISRFIDSADYAMRQAMARHLARPAKATRRLYARDEPTVRFSGSPPGGYLVCDEGRATPADDPAAPRALRQAANGRFLIGTAVSSRQLDNPKLAALIVEQFDCLTAENEFKPASVHPRVGEFRFTAADKMVDFAREHRMKVVGHTLCWHSQSPAFLYRGVDGKPLSRDEALKNLKDHIDGVMGHFKGKLVGWDVVNEAIGDAKGEYLRNTPARRAIGDNYIAKAFEFARAADPDAELYYNDYGNEQPEKLEKTIRLIRDLKAAGVRLDGVGMQCHMRLDDVEAPDRLDRAIAAYAAEGVKVMITELDVDVLPRRGRGADVAAREQGGANPYKDGLPPEVAEAQARFYSRLFRVVRKHPGVVTRVTFWGPHDGASWLNFWPVAGRTNHPLLWDRALKPKPALGAVLDALATP